MQKPAGALAQEHRLAVEDKRGLLCAAVPGETAQRIYDRQHVLAGNAGRGRKLVAVEHADRIERPARLERGNRIEKLVFAVEGEKVPEIVLGHVPHILVEHAVVECAESLELVVPEPCERHEFVELFRRDGLDIVSAILDEFGHY